MDEIRPICKDCNKNLAKRHSRNVDGSSNFKRRCGGCDNQRFYGKRHIRKPYKKYSKAYYHLKKNYCEQCDFKALHQCQLDVDHIDGNRENNNESNLQTLCSNCHRYKTQISRDCYAKQYRKVG